MTPALPDLTQLSNDDMITVISDDEQVILSAKYLAMRDAGSTMIQIAEEFGLTTRAGMYARIKKWRESGALDRAKSAFLIPKDEEIQVANRYVLDQWPNIVKRMVKIALLGKEHNAILAYEVLRARVVDPMLSRQIDPGSAEADYANKSGEFNPAIIVAPKLLE